MPSAEKSLEKSGKAITANDAGTALDAQKEFQERLSKALAAMGSAMAQNLQLKGSSEGNSPMGASSMTSLPLTPPSLDSFSGMAFGSESSGSEIGDADLDALLSGEDPETQSGSGEGEGNLPKVTNPQLPQLACLQAFHLLHKEAESHKGEVRRRKGNRAIPTQRCLRQEREADQRRLPWGPQIPLPHQ